MTACATGNPERIKAAAKAQADTKLFDQAIEQGRSIPALPADCRNRERSGVVAGDRLDTALIKTDAALSRANDRVTRCAAWHDGIRTRTGTGQ